MKFIKIDQMYQSFYRISNTKIPRFPKNSLFSSFFPNAMRLNWIASDFEMIVLEGFYDLSKFLETSTRCLDEKHIFQRTNAERQL